MTQRQFLQQRATRYEAEWVERQHADPDGEWNPDRDEYSVSYHTIEDQR